MKAKNSLRHFVMVAAVFIIVSSILISIIWGAELSRTDWEVIAALIFSLFAGCIILFFLIRWRDKK